MKQLVAILTLAALVVTTAFAQPTVKPIVRSFLSANQDMSLTQRPVFWTNNTTFADDTSNIRYVDPSWTLRYSQASNYITPTFASGTVLNGSFIGTASQVTYYDTNYFTNAASTIYPSPFVEVPLWGTSSGGAGIAALSLTAAGVAAANTNLITWYFVKSNDGANYDYNIPLIVAQAISGSTNCTTTTNLSTDFTTGARKIKFWKATVANSTKASYGTLGPVTLSGYAQ